MNKISDEAKAARNAYQRAWRLKNADKMRQYTINYWEKRAATYTPEVKARDLYAKGYTQRQIAEELSISLGTVNKYLNAQ